MLAESTAGRCGSPAPTTISGRPDWLISWQAAQSAETSSGPRSCISSMNTATPLPTSAARPPTSVSSSTRSISMSPESARPRAAGASMPGLHRSRSLASRPASRWAKDRSTPSTWSTSLGLRVAELAHRLVQRRGQRPAQPLVGAGLELAGPPAACGPRRERSALSSTVLPTPRSPVSTRERSGRPAATRSSTTSKARELLVAPGQLGRALAGAGGVGVPDRVHARTVSACLARFSRHPAAGRRAAWGAWIRCSSLWGGQPEASSPSVRLPGGAGSRMYRSTAAATSTTPRRCPTARPRSRPGSG